jgi:hypothetical protein
LGLFDTINALDTTGKVMPLDKEKVMKKTMICVATLAFMGFAQAEQSATEKAADMARDAKHSMKKGAHRVKEAVCMEGDLKCAGKKAGHRVDEAADATKNKAKEMADKVDSDTKANH